MARDDIDRRSLLRLGGVAAVSSLAGCGGQSSGALTEPTETPPESERGGSDQPPGADQLRRARQPPVERNRRGDDARLGAGGRTERVPPAVVWVEQGTTVS